MIWVFTHKWMPEPRHCTHCQILLNQIQPYTVIWNATTRTDSTVDPDLVGQAEKGHCQILSTIWEHNERIYCILNTEVNIILLYRNKQHPESSIIKWGCRPLHENFHLVLMLACFGNVQICIELNFEPSGLHFGTRLTRLAFEADICTWWKGIPVQRFSEFLFNLFLRILAIDIVILINVIDLSQKIIELSKDRDDGYCKILIWNLKEGVKRNLFLPSPSQRTPFPVAIEAEHCSEQYKTFHHRTDHQWPVYTLR